MSLQDIRSECSDTAALLQPYVDGELAVAEQERVACHLEDCRPCRSAVAEQQWVRATLRAVDRDTAPKSLRARIGAALDAVDAEQPALPVRRPAPARGPSLWARLGGAVADMARGAMVMVPASAVAVGLFFVAREGFVPVERMPAQGLGAALGTAPQAADPAQTVAVVPPTPAARPGESLPPVHAVPRGELQLVRADLEPGDHNAAGARLRYQVLREGLPTGQHVIDHQAPRGVAPMQGLPVEFRGHRFLVDHTVGGEPALRFDYGGVAHRLVLEGGPRHGDIAVLLELAEQKVTEQPRP